MDSTKSASLHAALLDVVNHRLAVAQAKARLKRDEAKFRLENDWSTYPKVTESLKEDVTTLKFYNRRLAFNRLVYKLNLAEASLEAIRAEVDIAARRPWRDVSISEKE